MTHGDDQPAIAAALRHYRSVTIRFTDLDGHDTVFDLETGTLHVHPDADLRPAITAALRQVELALSGRVEREFAVIDGALACAPAREPQRFHPWGLRIVEDVV